MVCTDAKAAERESLSASFAAAAAAAAKGVAAGAAAASPRLHFFDVGVALHAFAQLLQQQQQQQQQNDEDEESVLRQALGPRLLLLLRRHPGAAALAEWAAAAAADVFVGSSGSRVSLHLRNDRSRLGFPFFLSAADLCPDADAAAAAAQGQSPAAVAAAAAAKNAAPTAAAAAAAAAEHLYTDLPLCSARESILPAMQTRSENAIKKEQRIKTLNPKKP